MRPLELDRVLILQLQSTSMDNHQNKHQTYETMWLKV